MLADVTKPPLPIQNRPNSRGSYSRGAQQFLVDHQPNTNRRYWSGAVMVSCWLHVALMLCLASMYSFREVTDGISVASSWSADKPHELNEVTVDLPAQSEETSVLSFQHTLALAEVKTDLRNLPHPERSERPAAPPSPIMLSVGDDDEDGDAELNAGAGRPAGNGAGAGSGTGGSGAAGGGEEVEFFGKRAVARKVVFVVDRSGSMDQLGTGGLTRFQQLQVELAKAIQGLAPHQECSIIYYSNEPLFISGRKLVKAKSKAKRLILANMAMVQPGGGTQPLLAMEAALSLKPDVIYLLTDGRFDEATCQILWDTHTRSTIIHTFAFGERSGEQILKRLARQNRGDYLFIK